MPYNINERTGDVSLISGRRIGFLYNISMVRLAFGSQVNRISDIISLMQFDRNGTFSFIITSECSNSI